MRAVRTKFLFTIILLLAAISVHASTHKDEWQKIEVPEVVMTVAEEDGGYRDIRPGCAFSYLPDGVAAGLPNQSFHFYYRQGKQKDKTLIYFNGGGACWSGATCLTSLVLGNRFVFNPAINQENTPILAGGILNNHKDNPVRDWNVVFIPYCTGDVHIGSKDTVYSDPLGLINEGNPMLVQHRGFDNFIAVREWIKHNTPRKKTKHVLVAGSSAGAYGALLNFPRLRNIYSKETQVALLVDAGVGVFTQPFVDRIFNQADGGTWDAQDNLATWVPGFDKAGTYSAATFYQEIIVGLASFFPKDRIGQYTSAWDGEQTLFLNIMQQTDAGSINPLEWSNILPETWLEWHARMRNTLNVTAQEKNVGFYLGAGTDHAALIDVFRFNYFYEERSAQKPYLTDWVKRLFDDDKKWSNILPQTWLEWHARIRNTLNVTAREKNAGFYLGAGTDHAALIDVFRPNHFYEERSAQGVYLTDWVKRLLDDDKKLRSLSCSDNCGAPF